MIGRVAAAWRRRRPPQQVRAAAEAAKAGRLLSWAPLTDDGAALAATVRGLLVVTGGEPELLAWHEIDSAAWQPPLQYVQPTGGPERRWQLPDPGSLPRDVRTRVEQSIAWSTHHRLARRGAGVRVVARRPAGGGALQWRLVPDDGTDLTDPALLTEAEQHLVAARSAVG